jgi:hypothetical protein
MQKFSTYARSTAAVEAYWEQRSTGTSGRGAQGGHASRLLASPQAGVCARQGVASQGQHQP